MHPKHYTPPLTGLAQNQNKSCAELSIQSSDRVKRVNRVEWRFVRYPSYEWMCSILKTFSISVLFGAFQAHMSPFHLSFIHFSWLLCSVGKFNINFVRNSNSWVQYPICKVHIVDSGASKRLDDSHFNGYDYDCMDCRHFCIYNNNRTVHSNMLHSRIRDWENAYILHTVSYVNLIEWYLSRLNINHYYYYYCRWRISSKCTM